MMPNTTRRRFLQQSIAGAGSALASGAIVGRLQPACPAFAGLAAPSATPNADKLGWKLACQLYTFRRFSFYEALEIIDQLGFRCVEPCFFLRLSKDDPNLKTSEMLPQEQRAELRRRLAERGIRMTNFYTDLGTDEAECRKRFQFAKEMGVEILVAEPPAEAFAMLDQLCSEFDLKLAIHNHPQGPNSQYWHPDRVLAVCEGRSPRIGGCCDTGHWVRSGLDPLQCLRKMAGRIVSMHLKDVAESGKPESRDVPLGTGKANYAALLAELHRQGFRGVMSIEYEHDSPQLVDDVAACVRFVEETAGKLLA